MNRPTSTILLALAFVLVAAPVLAQGPGQGGQEEDPIQKLKEIQQLMSEIEKDLAKASLDQGVQADEQWVEEQLEKLMRSGKSQEEAREQIEKLFEKSGRESGAASEEIQKLLEQFEKQKESARKIEEMEEAQQDIVEKLKQLLESTQKAEDAAQKIEKMFEASEGKQKQVIDQIQQLIESAKRMKQQGQGQPKPGEEPKDGEGEKPKDEPQAKNPQNEKDGQETPEDKESEADRQRGNPRDNPKEEKDPPSDKADRWGELQKRIMEQGTTGGNAGRLPGYSDLANEYFKRITGGANEED